MSMLGDIRELLRQLKKDPLAAKELGATRKAGLQVFGWMVFVEVIRTAAMIPIKYFFDGLPTRSLSYEWTIAAIMGIVLIAQSWLEFRMDRAREASFYEMWSFWWGYGHWRALRLSTDWHVKHSTGEKESQLEKNVARVQRLVDAAMFDTGPVILIIVVTTILVAAIKWQFAVLAVLTMGIFALQFLHSDKRNQPIRREQQSEMKDIEQHGTDISAMWRAIKNSGNADDVGLENWKMLQRFVIKQVERINKYLSNVFPQSVTVDLSQMSTYMVLAFLFHGAGAGVGTAVLISAWMGRIYQNFYRVTEIQRYLQEGGEAFRELIKLITAVPTIQQPDNPLWPRQLRGEIVYDHVGFNYPDGGRQDALRDVSVRILAGSTVALVGLSGSGKSTFASLLLREYDPSRGVIRIDGVDLKQLDLNRYLRESVSVVSQTPQLFDATIAHNIRLFKSDATQEEMEEAARLAGAFEFIQELESGFETRVGENGVRLSGGQKQRIAIARALVRNPKILILDEATSALDAISQQKVLKSFEAQGGPTKVIIAHRLSTIKGASLILVMENGEIVERGTWTELLAMEGTFKRLRDIEMEGGLDVDTELQSALVPEQASCA